LFRYIEIYIHLTIQSYRKDSYLFSLKIKECFLTVGEGDEFHHMKTPVGNIFKTSEFERQASQCHECDERHIDDHYRADANPTEVDSKAHKKKGHF
jgi:hypothetical protein